MGAGNIVLEPGQQRVVVFVCGSGREYRSSTDGDEVTIATYGLGEIFGLEFASLSVRCRSTLAATAGQTEVAVLSPVTVREFLKSHPDVLLSAFDLGAKRRELTANHLEELALYDVTARVAHELARRAEDSDDDRILATHAEIATWIGSSEREARKGLRQLKDQGLTMSNRHRRGIIVIDRRRLAAYKKKSR
jgi:CRP-like cAMP-binding protein